MADDRRKHPRKELYDFVVKVEIQGARVQAVILDISEGGAQILLPRGTKSVENDRIAVEFGNGISDITGIVRRSGDSPANPNQIAIGVQFEKAFDLGVLIS